MSKLHTEKCLCPACGLENELKRVLSTEGYVAVDLDYRVYARGVDPVRLLAMRCQRCSFAEYVTDFAKPVSEAVKNIVASKEYSALASDDRASDFPLIAYIKQAKQEPYERIGYCYLRASWFSADLGRPEEEEKFLRRAASRFESALDSSQVDVLDPAEKDRTWYLLGEIYRRLGYFEMALDCISRVTGQDFSGMARDQKNLISKRDTKRRRAKER